MYCIDIFNPDDTVISQLPILQNYTESILKLLEKVYFAADKLLINIMINAS